MMSCKILFFLKFLSIFVNKNLVPYRNFSKKFKILLNKFLENFLKFLSIFVNKNLVPYRNFSKKFKINFIFFAKKIFF